MKLVCIPYGCLCELQEFSINGIDADYEDFGDKSDCSPETAKPYGCGDMRFVRKEPSQEVIDKYHISEKEYGVVCDELESALSFGQCGWCI